MSNPPRSVTVEIDDREKYPVLFPPYVRWFDLDGRPHLIRVETTRRRLAVGDYRLASAPEGCVVERKGSLEELAGNLLTRDRRRCLSALLRLVRGCRQPVLLLDFSLPSALNVDGGSGPDPWQVASVLFHQVSSLGLQVFSCGACRGDGIRTRLGASLVMMMLAHAMQPRKLDSRELNHERSDLGALAGDLDPRPRVPDDPKPLP